MGLSERRVKQKIGNDPRNLAWRQDTNSFGAQFLLKAGHTPNTALGLTPSNGLINPIAVARKLDNSGIGVGRARREGDAEGGGAGGAGTGLDELLRRLQSGNNSPSGSPAPAERTLSGFAKAGASDNTDTVVVSADEASPVASGSGSPSVAGPPQVRRLAHRQRNLAAKRMANSNSMAMSEILGIRSGDNSPLPSPLLLGTPITSLEADSPASSTPDDTNQSDLISTNKLSVGDYFKMRMEEKRKGFEAAMKAAAAAASGESSSAPATPAFGEEEIVVVGGGAPAVVETAASVVEASSESEEEVVVVAPVEAVAVVEDKKKVKKTKRKASELDAGDASEDAEKARKRERKEKRRANKEAASAVEGSGAAEDGEGKKRKERKEKKEKKEKKSKKTE